ncbi:hypothetical protein VP01_1324g5 [Puccinia sorghi]|uniref:Uncharacterized protein n=1 Tax=Puccinia sorghi TaxID=27349 RepID=A0A0L6VPC6_9BASI|nr:hypothetical protein VP01_1324g5 [Puccinia sorghi]
MRKKRKPHLETTRETRIGWNKPFTPEDYEHLCTYLEDSKNYTSLFGDGSKTAIGVKRMTRSQSYEVFSTACNNRLTGGKKILRPNDLKRKPAQKCPCYHWFYAIFRDKANINSMFEFDHAAHMPISQTIVLVKCAQCVAAGGTNRVRASRAET